MSAVDGVPADLTEPCDECGGKGQIDDPQNPGVFDPSKSPSVTTRRCAVCNGTGKIRLNERMFDGSMTSRSMRKQIDELQFKNELNSGAVSLLKTENEQMKAFLVQTRQILLNCKIDDQSHGWIEARKSWLNFYDKHFRGVG